MNYSIEYHFNEHYILYLSGGTHGSRSFRNSRMNQSGMNLDEHSTSSVDGENGDHDLISRDEGESSTTAPPIGLERESGVGQTRPPSFQ